jgi:pyruvate-formate lyase
VVLAAAYLREIGAPDAEKKHGRVSPELLAQESPSMARAIMEKLGAPEKLIAQVCEIIEHQHQSDANGSVNSSIVHDAVLIASLEEKQKEGQLTSNEMAEALDSLFLTAIGVEEARTVLSG